MNTLRLTLLGILLAVPTGGQSQVATQSLPECGDAKVEYRSFDEAYKRQIVSTSSMLTRALSDSKDKHSSPQNTKWLAKTEPDYMKQGPWTTSVYFVSPGTNEVLKLSFLDHANGGVQVQWLSEKLVFGRVWWGRMYSTDFILDVEKGEYLYREMAHYGQLAQPCR